MRVANGTGVAPMPGVSCAFAATSYGVGVSTPQGVGCWTPAPPGGHLTNDAKTFNLTNDAGTARLTPA
jgi:hypothetical protein